MSVPGCLTNSKSLSQYCTCDLSPEAAEGCVDVCSCAVGFVVLALVGVVGLLPAVQLLVPGLLQSGMRIYLAQ